MIARLRACRPVSALFPLPASPAFAQTAPYPKEKPVTAKHAMVVTVHRLATDAGIRILHEGGNAMDATVANLRKRGYHVKVESPWSDGECIKIAPKTQVLQGGHDHRWSLGSTVGY